MNTCPKLINRHNDIINSMPPPVFEEKDRVRGTYLNMVAKGPDEMLAATQKRRTTSQISSSERHNSDRRKERSPSFLENVGPDIRHG